MNYVLRERNDYNQIYGWTIFIKITRFLIHFTGKLFAYPQVSKNKQVPARVIVLP